ncbi:hypothetical protein SNEBB_004581 [Seison nebaliae]|nr:hypothetical protein SNEBB_004581 [Seison nebaliae]
MIQENDVVIIKRGTTLRHGTIGKNRSVVINSRCSINLEGCIGYEYGSTFDVQSNGDMTILDGATTRRYLMEESVALIDEEFESAQSNELIKQDETNQMMSLEQIDDMHNSNHLPVQEKIGKLAMNNKSFEKKTIYSQNKYIDRKRRRYHNYFTIMKPTNKLIYELISNQNKVKRMPISKTLFLRFDIMSQILLYGNVNYKSKIILVDETKGLLLTSILSRILPMNIEENEIEGEIHYFTPNGTLDSARYCLDLLNYDREKILKKCIYCHRMSDLSRIVELFQEKNENDDQWLLNGERKVDGKRLLNCDTLIFCGIMNPLELFKIFGWIIKPGSHVVVCHPYEQYIKSCYDEMKNAKSRIYPHSNFKYLNVNIYRNFSRQMLVNEERTRPNHSLLLSGSYPFVSANKINN